MKTRLMNFSDVAVDVVVLMELMVCGWLFFHRP
jgi:hypothetical protein